MKCSAKYLKRFKITTSYIDESGFTLIMRDRDLNGYDFCLDVLKWLAGDIQILKIEEIG